MNGIYRFMIRPLGSTDDPTGYDINAATSSDPVVEATAAYIRLCGCEIVKQGWSNGKLAGGPDAGCLTEEEVLEAQQAKIDVRKEQLRRQGL